MTVILKVKPMNLDTEQGHILVCLILIVLAVLVALDPLPIPHEIKASISPGLWTLAATTLGKALAESSSSK